MGSMDFDGRMRRVEKENQELKRRNDGFNDLEKRVSSLSKEMDMGAVMK